jgi:MarR family transcriptional regulator, organic hydroperoxide resistance regulator
MVEGAETANTELMREAEEVMTTVRVLYRLLCRSFDPEIAASGLTVPQVNALEELTREDGLSLKELSARMGLSHSTVSGIVDRLERRGFVGRRTDPKDRRYNRIFLSEKVKEYVRDVVPSRTLGPILKALALASAEERAQALAGIRTLRRLSEAVVSAGGEDQNAKTAASGQEMEDLR